MTTTSIKIKKDNDSNEYYIDIQDLSHIFDNVDKVSSYTMEWTEDGSTVVKFFDDNGNVIIPKK